MRARGWLLDSMHSFEGKPGSTTLTEGARSSGTCTGGISVARAGGASGGGGGSSPLERSAAAAMVSQHMHGEPLLDGQAQCGAPPKQQEREAPNGKGHSNRRSGAVLRPQVHHDAGPRASGSGMDAVRRGSHRIPPIMSRRRPACMAMHCRARHLEAPPTATRPEHRSLVGGTCFMLGLPLPLPALLLALPLHVRRAPPPPPLACTLPPRALTPLPVRPPPAVFLLRPCPAQVRLSKPEQA